MVRKLNLKQESTALRKKFMKSDYGNNRNFYWTYEGLVIFGTWREGGVGELQAEPRRIRMDFFLKKGGRYKIYLCNPFLFSTMKKNYQLTFNRNNFKIEENISL